MAIDRFTLEFPTIRHKWGALEFINEFSEEDIHPCGTNKLYTLRQSSGQFKSYEEWLECCKNNRYAERSATGIPTETYFLVRERDQHIIGMTTIRFELDDHYWNNGGNISYCIRKSERGKGVGKINLFLALKVCYERDIEAVLLDCDQDNIASKRTMRALDAKLIRNQWSDLYYSWKQVFVIDVTESVINHFDEYMYKTF